MKYLSSWEARTRQWLQRWVEEDAVDEVLIILESKNKTALACILVVAALGTIQLRQRLRSHKIQSSVLKAKQISKPNHTSNITYKNYHSKQ